MLKVMKNQIRSLGEMHTRRASATDSLVTRFIKESWI